MKDDSGDFKKHSHSDVSIKAHPKLFQNQAFISSHPSKSNIGTSNECETIENQHPVQLEYGDNATIDDEQSILVDMLALPRVNSVTDHSSSSTMDAGDCIPLKPINFDYKRQESNSQSFVGFRLSYLFVTLVVKLADGLQGTHLYVLYESYGYSVAMLYSLGFMAGAITAPFTGQLIDHFGRKKAALLYCALEVCINHLEQYPLLAGLVLSRVVGGITTNLLSIVFEAWVDTEYQITCLPRERYEIIMRDSVIVSNLAAIASGYLSHVLAETLGPVGPFEGAVTCTAIAFAVIFVLWNENYGDPGKEDQLASSYARWRSTLNYIKADSRILRMCIIQGFSLGALHVFIFLWSPLLKEFASGASIGGQTHLFGMDKRNEPAYGLIFGSFMAAGVMGGLCSPSFRKIFLFRLEQPISESPSSVMGFTSEEEEIIMQRSVVLHGAVCYFVGSLLLMVPCLLSASNGVAFTLSLLAFVFFEFSVGMCSPCEGVIRSLYIPSELRGAIMALPTLIVNVSVGVAVVATERVSKQNSLAFVSVLLASAGFLQLSLISPREWTNIVGRMENAKYYPFCSINSIYSLVKGISIGKVAHIQGGYKFWEADKTS